MEFHKEDFRVVIEQKCSNSVHENVNISQGDTFLIITRYEVLTLVESRQAGRSLRPQLIPEE